MRQAAKHLIAGLLALLALGSGAAQAATPQPFQANDYGGFNAVLPPGTNDLANLVQLGAFEASGARPPHNNDQYAAYANLVYAPSPLTAAQIPNYFHDESFGAAPGQVERTYNPRGDVAIQRDNLGVPHVYGDTRAGAMFGLGYAAAEDRLFFMDVLRRGTRAALLLRGGLAGQSRDGPRGLGRDPLQRGRPAAPVRLPASRLRDRHRPAARRRQQLHRRDQPVYLRGEAGPDEDAGRVRGDQPTTWPDRLELPRRRRDRVAGRPDLRQGRRPRAGLGADLRGGAAALRRQEGQEGLGRLPKPGRPRCPDHRAPQEVPLRDAAAAYSVRSVACSATARCAREPRTRC